MRNPTALLCLGTILSTAGAISAAQSPASDGNPEAASTSAPSAFVYVASTPKNSSTRQIVAYRAAANGSLTAIPGSPFAENVASMAVNGKFLMAASQSSPQIDAFTIGSNGALHFASSSDYAKFNAGSNSDCGTAGPIFFDHTGTWLYVMEFEGSSSCSSNIYASFKVSKTKGALTYLGMANTGNFPGVYEKAYSTGNNLFAYSAANSSCLYFQFYGFKRASNGELSMLSNVQKNSPKPPSGVSAFIPTFAVADPTNHLAVAVQPANPPECSSGPLQMATYTVSSSGALTTSSTAKNMPASSVKTVYDMRMDSTGKLLAIGGQEGLQIFHFNGASPMTHYTNLLTTARIDQMFWDNSGHLYAISQTTGKLFVFTVTPTSAKAAPGSPHAISTPDSLIVQPLAAHTK